MAKLAGLFLVLLVASIAFADYIQSGDGGAAFAADLSIQKCKDQNVSAVFICSGSVVKVISKNADEGMTFYKPDGSVVYCPDVLPTDMGAECVQLLGPNLCPSKSVCPSTNGTNVVQQPIPPGMNETAPLPAPVRGNETPANQTANGTTQEEPKIEPSGTKASDFYIYGVIVVGMVVIAFLNYVYFKTRGTGTS